MVVNGVSSLSVPRGKHNGHLRGPAHPRWNHGTLKSSQGYVLVRVGKDHPLADANGYAYEHRLKVYEQTGEIPPLVHHDNDERDDNSPENLIVKTKAEHNSLHLASRSRDSLGRFLPRDAGQGDRTPFPS